MEIGRVADPPENARRCIIRRRHLRTRLVSYTLMSFLMSVLSDLMATDGDETGVTCDDDAGEAQTLIGELRLQMCTSPALQSAKKNSGGRYLPPTPELSAAVPITPVQGISVMVVLCHPWKPNNLRREF